MGIFNDRVKELRLSKNLSLRQLSKISGLSPSAIHAYEIGSREPTKTSLEALADVFNVDMDYLLGKSNIKNAAANALGFDSLYEAWVNKKLPEQQMLSEGEELWLSLFRQIPDESRAEAVNYVRSALKIAGLIQ